MKSWKIIIKITLKGINLTLPKDLHLKHGDKTQDNENMRFSVTQMKMIQRDAMMMMANYLIK